MSIDSDGVRSISLIYTAHIFGWIYFTAWTVSFYPQLWLNFKKSSTDGLSYDFAIYNLIGFVSYVCYDIIRYITQQKYDLASAVEVQDLCFAIHAFALTALLCGQIVLYDFHMMLYNFSRVCVLASTTTMLAIIVHLLAASHGLMMLTDTPDKSKGDYLFPLWSVTEFFGAVKVVVTLVKYLPQILLNFERKLTRGMAVWTFNLDALGGLLSLGQNILEAYNHRDFAYISGNYPKIAIGLVGLAYDAILLSQHYIIYRENNLAHEPCPTGSVISKENLTLEFVDTRSCGTMSPSFESTQPACTHDPA